MASVNNTIELDAISSLSTDDIIEVCDAVGLANDGGATFYKPTKATVGELTTFMNQQIANSSSYSATSTSASYAATVPVQTLAHTASYFITTGITATDIYVTSGSVVVTASFVNGLLTALVA